MLFYEFRGDNWRYVVTSGKFKSTASGSESPSSTTGGGKTPDGVGGAFGGNKKGPGKGKDGQLCCPRCGDPCTFVETFVCKCSFYLL